MTNLTKLTAEELLALNGAVDWDQELIFAEIRRRLERLEKCEAALKPFADAWASRPLDYDKGKQFTLNCRQQDHRHFQQAWELIYGSRAALENR